MFLLQAIELKTGMPGTGLLSESIKYPPEKIPQQYGGGSVPSSVFPHLSLALLHFTPTCGSVGSTGGLGPGLG